MSIARYCLIALAAVLACRGGNVEPAGALLTGVVEDQSGGVVPAAKLTLTNGKSGAELKAKPNEEGRFRFESVPAGSYQLKVKAEHFETVEMSVKVKDAEPKPLRIRMELKGKGEQITVTSESGSTVETALDPSDNANALKLEEHLLFQLPVQDQDIVGTLSNFLSPAAQGAMGPSVVVDGVEGDFDVPAWSIKRIRINKNPYSALFRRPGSARIEVTTRDGRSNFHGGVAIFARDAALDARNPLARSKPDMSKRLLEARVTGPISGPFWYFFSAERLDDKESAIVNARTPSGSVIENVATPLYRSNLLGRIDIRPNRMHAMSLRYTLLETTQRNRGTGGFDLPEHGYSSWERESNIQFADRRISNANISNDFRFQVERSEDRLGSPAAAPALSVAGAFTSGPSQNFRSERDSSVKFQDGVNYYLGRHRIQFGGQFRARFIDARQQTNFGGTFEFSSLEQFAAGRPYVFRVDQGQPAVSFTQNEAYDFVQDEVKLLPNLQLLAGLRHEWHANLEGGHRLAPRLSIAYSPGQQPKTVFRAGAGVFYEELPKTVVRQSMLFDGLHLRELVIANPAFPDPLGGAPAALLPQSIVRTAPGLTLPMMTQASFGVERELQKKVQLTVEYRTLRAVHLYRSRNINAPLEEGLPRPDPNFLNINQVESTGSMRSHSLETALRWNAKRFSGMAQYTLLSTHDDAYGVFALPANNYDLRPEWGRADYDRRHQFSLMGGADLPRKTHFATIITVGSGLPYNIRTGRDDNGDSSATDRPAGVTRNTGQGAGTAQVNMRLTKTFDVWRLYKSAKKDTNNLELSLDIFNTFNHTNYDRFVGVLTSPFFGRANSASQPRSLQTSLRYSW